MGRPRLYSDEQHREKRRIKSQKWREENRTRSREITRESMKRASDQAAIAAGRAPGKIGRPAKSKTIEDKRRLQNNRVKRWYKENLSLARAIGAAAARNRRGRIRKADGRHTAEQIDELRRRQKNKCSFCLKSLGSSTPHIDHHLPLVLGGSNGIGNLRLLHPKCNLIKGAKHPIEHALSHGMLCW